ncbi:MAG: hypothetical protein P4L84_29935 [Isosphaeraceae bacterium]|nr:hypothetical protein [Isosphaeraceae bacterium]
MPGLGLSGLVLSLVVLQAVDARHPADLVTRRAAPRYADRQAPGEALVKIGSEVLSTLAIARDSRNLELHERAQPLAARRHAVEALRATRLRFDIRDRR